ncbi:MAG: oligosaccharide flippase family protein [Bacteroidota bacterium]
MSTPDPDPPPGNDGRGQVQDEVQRGAVVNALGLAAKVTGPLFLLVVTRLYGAEVFGVFVSAAALVEIALALLTSGFRDAAVRYVARYAESDRARLYDALANTLGLSIGGAMLLAAATQVVAVPIVRALYDFGDVLAPAVQVMALALPLMAFERIVLAATQGLRIMKYEAFFGGALKSLILLVMAYALHLAMPTVQGLVIAWMLAQATSSFVALAIYGREFAWRPLGHAFRRFRLDRKLLSFAIPQNLNMTLNRFLTGVDVLMLGALGASAAAVGTYGAGAAVVREIRQVRLAFSSALAPQIARLYGQGEREALSRVYSTTARWTATLGIPLLLAVAVLHTDLLRVFYPDYEDAAAFMLWLLLIPYLSTGFGLAGNVVVMTGHSRLNLFNSVSSGIINVALNFVLIPRFGLVGAAAASALGSLVTTVLQLFEAHWIVGVSMQLGVIYRPHVAGLVGLGVVVGIALAVPLPSMPLGYRIGAALAGAVVYGLVLWALTGRPGPPEAV